MNSSSYLDDISDLENSTQVASWILQEFQSPFHIDGREMFITASIGIVMSVTGYNTPEDVLRDADIAMYHAKANGKARFEIFYPTLRTRVMERLEMETDLRQGSGAPGIRDPLPDHRLHSNRADHRM